MLVQLAIRDIVLIERLDIGFAAGLSVLTGETGAGKSILLDALSLALGGRGDGGLVRHGESRGQVTAVFDLPGDHAARVLARDNDIPDDGDLILRRVQFADGRTRAFVNDQPVSVQALRAIGAALVEIHGQHDERALVDPAAHRALLDAFGGHDSRATAQAHQRLRAARQALDDHRDRIERARREADFLAHAVDELKTLAPMQGEEEELAASRQRMMQAEKVVGEINEAYDAVAGHASPSPALSSVLRRLERRAAQAPSLCEPSVKALDAVLAALDEARLALEAAQREAAFDPRELERTEERLFALRAAARKYNVAADDLAALRKRYEADLAAIHAGEEELAARETAVAEAEAAYGAAARALSAARRASASALEEAVNRELPPLRLERARFIVHIETDEEQRAAEGFDRVEFWVRTNPGTRPGPLMKVASGGELSRFMLALKVSLADRGSAPTLVFDEIDSGAGGAVADAIGARLARLAARVQVMAVTHAPQVAARAQRHFLISKDSVSEEAGGATERIATRVLAIEAAARREEIARMLAGATITDEARAAAQRLLEAAD
ncbi:DNA repair protein RecN [Alsobacter sp. SYSU M60028]|uniref:DNA repair protein RecN n=1 Tax=Alsobacter ponti TaxID=2962936 RepID=A0ABT1L6Y6_9HYPH|nr:DNA repair protein RecN [Alsobacter ponti]MCP8937189.1 DNA repair protein RecN [Alsobacter ponti]